MDIGHYNCRDYHISPHFAPTTLSNTHRRHPSYLLSTRHESFDELEQRARSPASTKPKFPFLSLPLELRQQILSYLLPRTEDTSVHPRGGAGASHAEPRYAPSSVVWRRGDIGMFGVCRQLHDECADIMYGSNTFLLFVTYSTIVFRFNWLLQSGLAPTRRFPFLELLPSKYILRIKRVVVNIDHVDGYTAAIKFNVSPQGLMHGLRGQLQRLVFALKSSSAAKARPFFESDGSEEWDAPRPTTEDGLREQRRLAKIVIRVSASNDVLEQIKSSVKKHRNASPLRSCGDPLDNGAALRSSPDMAPKASRDVDALLQPFGQLHGVREVAIIGAVSHAAVQELEAQMLSLDRVALNAL